MKKSASTLSACHAGKAYQVLLKKFQDPHEPEDPRHSKNLPQA